MLTVVMLIATFVHVVLSVAMLNVVMLTVVMLIVTFCYMLC